MSTVEQFTENDRLRLAKFDWLKANRGILTRIGKSLEPRVSASVVSRVFNGRERSARIEEALREVGAPGFNGIMAQQ